MARTSSVLLLTAVAAVTAACGDAPGPKIDDDAAPPDAATLDGGTLTDGGTLPDGGMLPDAGVDVDAGPVSYPYSDLDVGCAPVFAQNVLPEYHLTLTPEDWAAIDHEFRNPQLTSSGSIIEPPYHPTQLRVVQGANTYDPTGVMIRINGNTSWLQAIEHDANPKMQFLIAFNKVDPDGRFQEQRKIKLDMPRSDWTFLQQRVALAWMRGRAGVPAQCANNARVYVNGAYYGLYTNAEFQDKGFLKRVFGGADNDGDLWKAGREIKTNEETHGWTRITAFWALNDLGNMDPLIDLDMSMLEWVSEAIIGDSDGYNQGRPNYYLYDRPSTQKFVWLANDLDTTLDEDFLPPDTTPVLAPTPPDERRWERDWHHYLIAMNQPAGVARYVAAMRTQLPKLDPAEIAMWVDDWSAQIAVAAAEDSHRPFSMADHAGALVRIKEYSPDRKVYLQRWLDCWNGGGADADGDGFDMCHDCKDSNAAQSPAATEVCDEIDNDCDGRVDNVGGDTSCAAAFDGDEESARLNELWRRVRLDVKAEAKLRRAPR